MGKTLYIIGNGFDIFHGLPTSYRCFLCFMLTNYPNDAKRLGFLFDRSNPKKLWSDFETELEKFDSLELVKRNIENWIHTKEINEFKNMFDDVHSQLQTFFHEWVLQIQMGMDNGNRLNFVENALFLNFNYTNTLEDFYHIESSNICHIHSDTLNTNSCKPIVGHAREHNCVEKDECIVCKFIRQYGKYPQWAINSEDFAEVVMEELNNLWDGLAKESIIKHMPGHKIYTIDQNRSFFDACRNCDDIFIMGCSLSSVDKDYYTEIFELSPNARWHISMYNENEAEVKTKFANLLDIKEEEVCVETFYMDNLLIK